MSATNLPPPPSAPNLAGDPERRSCPPTRFVDWLDWLPWEKILIWGLFLGAVYTLRHFFFVIFMTFIVSYVMRRVVVRTSRFLTGGRESIFLERVFTLVGFGLLLFGVYEGAKYLGPKLVAQAKALVERGSRLDPRREIEEFVTRTVGAMLFQREYGSRTDARYEKAFEAFQALDKDAEAFDEFAEFERRLKVRFLEKERARVIAEADASSQAEERFEAWVFAEKAPGIFAENEVSYLERHDRDYEEAYRAGFVDKPLEEARREPDFEKRRLERICRRIVEDELRKDPRRWEGLRKEWLAGVADAAVAALQSAPGYEDAFRRFYENELRSSATPAQDRPPYTYEKYVALSRAYPQGKEAFVAALRESDAGAPEEGAPREHEAFEYAKQKELAMRFMAREDVQEIVRNLNPYAQEGVKKFADGLRSGVAYLVTIPFQLALSLLLSFFITMDMPRIKAGVRRLKTSRMRDFYEEIAPGLYTFGRLIGRAFQAQGVIAFFNTVFTFLAIQYIGIQNEVFLCAIVFVCSFIPVFGVVMSSVPIAVMAVIQPDGSVYKALAVIAAILVIHFFETSVLNPKILGDMLHLHPVLVLAVLAIGEHFAGVWGLLLGVPVAVFVIRCVILNEEIPGLTDRAPAFASAGEGGRGGEEKVRGPPRGPPPETKGEPAPAGHGAAVRAEAFETPR
ncbi:MAG: AI-2E family transporter [Planctomycetota bacterium]